MDKQVYSNVTYEVIAAATEVHAELGNGLLEAAYREALAIEFELRCIPYQQEQPLSLHYKGCILQQGYTPHFVVQDLLVVNLQTVRRNGPEVESQILNYLKATGYPVGLLLSFGFPGRLRWKSIVPGSFEFRRVVG